MSAVALIKVTGAFSLYQVFDRPGKQGLLLGTVARTGSLPSCYRWWANDAQGRPVGPSKRTRREAVELLRVEGLIDEVMTENVGLFQRLTDM